MGKPNVTKPCEEKVKLIKSVQSGWSRKNENVQIMWYSTYSWDINDRDFLEETCQLKIDKFLERQTQSRRNSSAVLTCIYKVK